MAGTAVQTYPPAKIGGPATKELAGTRLVYEYTTGLRAQLDFGLDTVTWVFLKVSNETSDPMPYRARKIRENLYMVHWINLPINTHVTLIVDFETRELHVSAMMPGAIEFFDIAEIETIERPS